MSFVKSPKVEYTPDGKPPERRDWRRILLRAGILALFLLALFLNLYAFRAGNVVNVVAGTNGIAHGMVVDEQGNPIAEALITLAMAANARAFSDENGRFELTNIPTGPQYLMVIHQGIGEGFVVEIQPNSVTEVGTLTYTAKPAVWR